MRFPYLVILTAALLAPVAAIAAPVNTGTESGVRLEQPEPRDIFTVAIIGDRTGGTEADIAILARAVDEMNRLRPDLVIHIGDMVNGYTYNPDIWKRQMEEFKSVIGRLEAPFYPVTGNHDTFPGTNRPGDRSNEELYKQYFGPLYYSFDYANSHFVCLYSDEARTSRPLYTDEQIAWLERDLAGCDQENIFVFSHKPSWEYRGGIWDPIHAILKEYPVRAVFGGHFHAYQKCGAKDGIEYYVMGATGGFIHKPEVGGGLQHLALMTVEGPEFSLSLLKTGTLLPDDYVLAEDYREFNQLDPLYNRGTEAQGSVPDPVEGEVDTEVPVEVRNPLPKPVRAALSVSDDCAPWASVPGETVVEVPARGTLTAKVRLRSPRVEPNAFVVPEILITYLYPDSKGRTVPIEIRSRVPTGRSLALTERKVEIAVDGRISELAWQEAEVLPVRFWKYSMYDVEADPVPEVRLLFDGKFLYLAADVTDNQPALFGEGPGVPVLSDAVQISVRTPEGEPRDFLFESLKDENGRLYRRINQAPQWEEAVTEGPDFEFETERNGKGYRVEARLRAALLFGEDGAPKTGTRFNVSIFDNDCNPYPLIRRWAAEEPDHWGVLSVQGK